VGVAGSTAPVSSHETHYGHVVSSGSAAIRTAGHRERFGAEELAVVLSHYDFGTIDSIVEFARGSRRAPKLLITAEHGRYLLKRRAKGKDDPFRVAFCHAIQLDLESKQFPLPHLLGTRKDNNSMLQWKGSVYEMFEYIPGQGYPYTLESTFDSGRVLGLYHKLLEKFKSPWQPGTGSYHRAASVISGLASLPAILAAHTGAAPAGAVSPAAAGAGAGATGGGATGGGGAGGPSGGAAGGGGAAAGGGELDAAGTIRFLADGYQHAAEMAESAGLNNWPRQIVHADWHPGNMLFRDNHVVAVIDYDSARLLPRIIDISNGALQFSIIGGSDDVTRWPDYLDESRFKRFLRGYDEVVLLSQAEIRALPWLMIQALIAEAVFPIAATGNFGRMQGLQFLQMVQRKVSWLKRCAEQLIELAGG
jgi:Ser/Thr protein kinase RdoA (MazF antagonist)